MSMSTTMQNSPYTSSNVLLASSTNIVPEPYQTTAQLRRQCPSPHTEVERLGTPDPTRRETEARREAWCEEW